MESLSRLIAANVYGDYALDDFYASLMFMGPPGVGKSGVQLLAAKDVAYILSETRKRRVKVVKVSMRVSSDEAARIASDVIAGKTVPYLHLYLPQTKIWHLEGTPSPNDNYVEVGGRRVPYNLWRLDPFIIPFLDYRELMKRENYVTPILVIDEFNMGRRDVREALFQLARSAELGKAKLNPLTIISLIGNTPETNSYVDADLPLPLLNRAMRFIVDKPDVPSWIGFMNEVYGTKWAKEVGAFLLLNKDYIYQVFDEDGSIVTPRTWTQLAARLYLAGIMAKEYGRDRSRAYTRYVVHGLLPDAVAEEFYSYYINVRRVNIDEIIRSPEKLTALEPNTAAYAVVTAVSKLVEEYKRTPPELRGLVTRRIRDIAAAASKVLSTEGLGLVLNSLPAPMRMSVAKYLPPDVKSNVTRIARMMKEYEEALST